ncbi:MAG: oligosaccharide flippase family protein, partial [bacterium]
VVIRCVVWLFYLLTSFKINTLLKTDFKFQFRISVIKPVLKMSIWITIVNTVGPIILYSDRFLISTLVSVSAVTFFSTPYEVITKLLLIPSALVGVLFPAFSASYQKDSDTSKHLFMRGFKFIFIILFPLVLFFVSFSYEIMNIWLGIKFAESSTLVLQFLSFGILFSSLSSIPNNYFQGIGKPQIPAILNLIELPFYLLGMYLSIKWYNIYGAAFFWMMAAAADALINYIIANKRFHIKIDFKFFYFSLILIAVGFLISFVIKILFIKIIIILPLILFVLYTGWTFYLTIDEKKFILSLAKLKLGLSIK